MTWLAVDYASPSALDSGRESALLGLAANARRPVRFRGTVKEHTCLLRFALRALGEAIWSNEGWLAQEVGQAVLDPIVTVHPDRLLFEAFSGDESTYVQLAVDPALFAIEGEVRTGTTNIDFTAWLWGALGELRSSRTTTLSIDPAGVEVATAGAGGRFEQKVELPPGWVRGLLQVQSAMALPGTRLAVRPIDLLAALRFLRYTNAKVAPRALRYEMEPGRDARLVLEPWERVVELKGASHGYDALRTIRTWGRQRLRLIEPLLPFAQSVRVYLKGRALPSFYAVELPHMTFLLGLSGWAGERWSGGTGFDLATDLDRVDEALLGRAIALLEREVKLSLDAAATALAIDRPAAARTLDALVRRGRVLYDMEAREYRHRELFETPVDEGALYPPDARREAATALVAAGAVRIERMEAEESRKPRRFKTPDGPVVREVIHRDWRVKGSAGDQPAVELVLNDAGRVIYGTCACAWFRENLLNRGPCEHLLALYVQSRATLRDLPTSEPGALPPSGQAKREADDEPQEDED
jgi:hypothetical protein